ncbi:MAG: translational GTPase TypA, partial [Oscillospiraceae bacterium]|nr:translational GTPase TypA [Oscillospiraceae bacterium]
DEVLELFMDLEANDDQLDSPFLFCSARAGIASNDPFTEGTDLRPLFDKIIEYIPEPSANCDEPMRLLVSSIDYNDYVGRIAIGRVESGIIRQNQEIVVCDYHNQREPKKAKITAMYQFEGLERVPVTEATAGNIICLSGIAEITIGDTICDTENPEPLPFVKISEPTVEMTFSVNDSPFAGREGKFVTTRNIKDRLERELLKDISLRVTPAENSSDAFIVSGRGEMHLSILIETMRREGYEFQVSTPRVLMREIDGVMCEPMEEVVADVPGDCSGSVIEKLCSRKGELRKMSQVGSRTRIEFIVPARGLFGYRNEFLTDTKGEGILNSIFHGYSPSKGDIPRRATGSLIAYETGEAVGYGIFNVQDRGSMFVSPGDNVYAGMIVGVSNKADDIVVNVCKKKQLTNMRASGSDDALRLVPPRILSLEQMLEFLADDELLEVTPESLRMRKRLLDHSARMKLLKGKQQ